MWAGQQSKVEAIFIPSASNGWLLNRAVFDTFITPTVGCYFNAWPLLSMTN
jgi:hypothetical protein